MDNREAKFILNAYRPGGQDAGDPRFAEALEQARRDPILERWFQDSIVFDAAVTEKLCVVAVPADLRENILAGVKISRPLRWSKPFVNWAIAAALISMAILGSLIWHNTRPARLAGWQTNALSVISSVVTGESKFDFRAHTPAKVVGWLAANHAPVAQKIPERLAGLPSLGCKTFSWNGIPASVICFMRKDGGLIHLVVTSPTAPTRAGTERDPQMVSQGSWTTATWRTGAAVYMVALEGSRDQLRSYLL